MSTGTFLFEIDMLKSLLDFSLITFKTTFVAEIIVLETKFKLLRQFYNCFVVAVLNGKLATLSEDGQLF